MADDNKIILQIVLDDGSVVRGMGTIRNESKKTAQESASAFEGVTEAMASPFNSAIEAIKNIHPAVKAAVALISLSLLGLKLAFDKAFEGERLKSLETQFNSLALGAGISGEALKKGLEEAGKGMFHLAEQASVVNRAIVELGANATKLPQILELSRKVAAGIGGNQNDVFEAILRSVETLSLKSLKQQGIVIDTEKALDNYARTLRLTAGELTNSQKQQALLNAILTETAGKFKNVEEGTKPMAAALSRVGVAFAHISEESSKAFSEAFGQGFATNLERIAAAFGGPQQKAILLESEIKRLQNTLNDKASLDQSFVPFLEKALADNVRQLENIRNIQNALRDDAQKAGRANGIGETAAQTLARKKAFDDQLKLNDDQVLAIKSRNQQINQLELQAAQDSIAVDQARAQQSLTDSDKRIKDAEVLSEQLILLGLQREQALDDIAIKFSDKKGFDEQQRAAARLAIIADFEAKRDLLETNGNQASADKLKTLTATAKSILVSGISSSVQALGAALVKGENAFDVFKNGVLGIIGDLMIQLGTAVIAQAVAIDALAKTIATGFGGFGIAAGVALIAAGGALKALVGGGTGINYGGEISHPVNAGNDFSTLSDIPETDRQRDIKPSVQFIVQGDLIDTPESGSRILNLLNDAFDRSGVELRGATA